MGCGRTILFAFYGVQQDDCTCASFCTVARWERLVRSWMVQKNGNRTDAGEPLCQGKRVLSASSHVRNVPQYTFLGPGNHVLVRAFKEERGLLESEVFSRSDRYDMTCSRWSSRFGRASAHNLAINLDLLKR